MRSERNGKDEKWEKRKGWEVREKKRIISEKKGKGWEVREKERMRSERKGKGGEVREKERMRSERKENVEKLEQRKGWEVR